MAPNRFQQNATRCSLLLLTSSACAAAMESPPANEELSKPIVTKSGKFDNPWTTTWQVTLKSLQEPCRFSPRTPGLTAVLARRRQS